MKKYNVMSQSPEGSLADFHPEDSTAAFLLGEVAIPRRVPRRFPLRAPGRTSRQQEMSQSPEGSLADFHRVRTWMQGHPSSSRNPPKGPSPISTPPLSSPSGSVACKGISANLPGTGLGEGQDRRGSNRPTPRNPIISKTLTHSWPVR